MHIGMFVWSNLGVVSTSLRPFVRLLDLKYLLRVAMSDLLSVTTYDTYRHGGIRIGCVDPNLYQSIDVAMIPKGTWFRSSVTCVATVRHFVRRRILGVRNE